MTAWYHVSVKDVYSIVRSIRDNGFSRNRHFDAHTSKESAEARRVHRFLRAIERDLRAAQQVRVARDESGYSVAMMFPEVRLTRVAALTVEEHALLCEDPRLARLLRPTG